MPQPESSPLTLPGARPAAPGPDAPPTRDVLGLPLAVADYEETLDWIEGTAAARARRYVCVASVHTAMLCAEDEAVRAAVLGSDLVVPDGQPLVWAMSALGAPEASRVYGPELMARHCARAADTGTRVYLYGGRTQGALVQLALNLRTRYPGLKIVGGHAPPFRELGEDELDEVAADIDRSRPDVVWVGIGAPKQERWMAAMRPRMAAPVLIGVGAAFDFHAGLVAQAPDWVQRAGLEWAFRLSREPRRLWRRYARYNPRFVVGFARQWLRERVLGRLRSARS